MTDRPILFSAPMVRALLDGRKTQTRRVLKLAGRRPDYIGPRGCQDDPTCWGWDNADGEYITVGPDDKDHLPGWRNGWLDWRGAYAPGDRLWVREAWAAGACADGLSPSMLAPGFWRKDNGGLWYAADGTAPPDPVTPKGKSRASLHMPRWASRLTLVVTDVRVQRLKAITREDAIAEGLIKASDAGPIARELGTDWGVEGLSQHGSPVSAFAALWDQINGRGAWDANPWVCAVSFTVHRANIDQMGEAA